MIPSSDTTKFVFKRERDRERQRETERPKKKKGREGHEGGAITGRTAETRKAGERTGGKASLVHFFLTSDGLEVFHARIGRRSR